MNWKLVFVQMGLHAQSLHEPLDFVTKILLKRLIIYTVAW